jgi:hypothetical protein
VTGNTTVSGTVAATQSGPWNVGILGTVQLRAVDEPARNFVQFSRSVGPTVGTITKSWNQDLQYVVPAGKRLVIDNVSVVSFALNSNVVTTPFLLVIGNNAAECAPNAIPNVYDQVINGDRAALAVPLLFNGLDTSASPNSNSYGNSMHLQAYADAGQYLGGRFAGAPSLTFPSALKVTVSGHLVTP